MLPWVHVKGTYQYLPSVASSTLRPHALRLHLIKDVSVHEKMAGQGQRREMKCLHSFFVSSSGRHIEQDQITEETTTRLVILASAPTRLHLTTPLAVLPLMSKRKPGSELISTHVIITRPTRGAAQCPMGRGAITGCWPLSTITARLVRQASGVKRDRQL